MRKRNKNKYEKIVNGAKTDLICRMKDKGYKLMGIATYGDARDLVFVFEGPLEDQYYISYTHFINAVNEHRYYEWREKLFSDLFAEEV